MKNKILTVLLILLGIVARAAINSGTPTGYLDRGMMFYNIGFYDASSDQLRFFNEISDPTEASRVEEALAAAKAGAPTALQLLERALWDYPATSARPYLYLVIGNIHLDNAASDSDAYQKAYEAYEMIGEKAFGPEYDAELKLRKAIAAIHTSRLHEAELLLSEIAGDRKYGADALYYQGYIAYSKGDFKKAKELLARASGNGPRSVMIPFCLAQINYMEGNDDEALRQAGRMMGMLPGIHPSYQGYGYEMSRISGEILHNRGENDKAIPLLKDYVDNIASARNSQESLPEESAGAFYILGLNDYNSGEFDSAISRLQTASRRQNIIGQCALLALGQVHFRDGDRHMAAICLDKAVKLDADPRVTEEAMFNYIAVLADGGGMPFTGTAPACDEFLQRFPDSRYTPQIAGYMARGYLADNNYEGALASILRVANPSPELLPVKLKVLYGLALQCLKDGKLEQAMKYAAEADKLGRHDPDIALECTLIEGDCLYRRGKYDDARKKYETYIKKAGRGIPNNIPLATYDLAYTLFNLERYQKAGSEYERYLRQPGETPASMQADAANRLGDCLYYQGKLQDAMRWYDKAAILNPASADYALYQRALVLGYQGKNDEKIATLKKFRQQYGNSPLVADAMLELAATQRQAGLDADAIATYKAIEHDFPVSSQGRRALFLLSSLQASRGDVNDAIASYKRLISRHSPSAEATAATEAFRELAVQEGRVDEYASFISTTANAPKLTNDELDDLTYRSARTARQLEQYLAKYPGGAHAAEALTTLMRNAVKSDDSDNALKFATRLVTEFPGSPLVGEGWQIKASIEAASGNATEALESYTQLERHASSADVITSARLGQLKAAQMLERHEDVIALADKLLENLSSGTSDYRNVSFTKSMSLKASGRSSEAVGIWTELAADPAELTGARSAYYLGEYYFETGQTDLAWKAVNALVESNTPHSYWLARGYILTSDLYRAQGDEFEAEEYLKVLKENYPGSEQEIFDMIEERMKK